MSEHTPTPWQVEVLPDHRKKPIRVTDSDGNDILFVCCEGEVSRDVAIANARLIVSSVNGREVIDETLAFTIKYLTNLSGSPDQLRLATLDRLRLAAKFLHKES
jgi:hypothetical protein